MAKDIIPYKFNPPSKRYKIKPKKIGIMAKAGKGFKKVGKTVGSVIKKGIRLSGVGLALTGAGYVAVLQAEDMLKLQSQAKEETLEIWF